MAALNDPNTSKNQQQQQTPSHKSGCIHADNKPVSSSTEGSSGDNAVLTNGTHPPAVDSPGPPTFSAPQVAPTPTAPPPAQPQQQASTTAAAPPPPSAHQPTGNKKVSGGGGGPPKKKTLDPSEVGSEIQPSMLLATAVCGHYFKCLSCLPLTSS